MLDLRLLKQAVTLARHRNFARAANALHVTQPALSRSIAGLERSLGEKLFNRTQQGVEPTAFGQMLLARAQALLDGAGDLERDFKLMRGLEIGELRVGAGPYPAEISLGAAVAQLTRRHPTLRIELSITDLRTIVGSIISRQLDLAVLELSTVEAETRIAVEALPQHAARFFVRRDHPLVGTRNLTLEQVLSFPFVGTRMPKRLAPRFLQAAKAGGIDPETGDYLPPVKVDSLRVVKEVVLGSDGVGVAPMPLIRRDVDDGALTALPLQQPWMTTCYGFVYLRDRMLSPAAEAFMAEVRAVERRLVAPPPGVDDRQSA